MTRPIVILLALLLSLGSAGSICGLWCGSPAAERHHESTGCHDGAGGSVWQVVGANTPCDAPAAATQLAWKAGGSGQGRTPAPTAVFSQAFAALPLPGFVTLLLPALQSPARRATTSLVLRL